MMSAEIINERNLKADLYPIIEQLRFSHSDANLTSKIKSQVKGKERKITTSDEFYIKSEVKRLAKPCARLIDLRSFAPGISFETFQWEGMVHILDKASAQLFLKLVKAYGGEYTFGVYEGVISAFKANKLIAKSQQFANDIEIETVSLSEVYSRNEERMNLGVKLSINKLSFASNSVPLEDLSARIGSDIKLLKKGDGIVGNSVDISQTGLQVKLSKNLQRGELVLVRFLGLEDDFIFQRKYIAYSVIKSSSAEKDNDYIIALKQVELPEHLEFQQFTKRLIYANKRRYKVNLDNTVKSVRSKLYEQFYLSRRNALDVFFDKSGDIPYMLASDPALDVIDWFRSQYQESLSALLKKDNVIDMANREGDLYWVVMKKESSKLKDGFSFYSTILSSSLSYKFLSYALRTGMGKLFKLSISSTQSANPFVTSSLPRSVHKQMGNSGVYRYAPQLKSLKSNISHLLTLKEITNDQMDIFDAHCLNITKNELASCATYHLKTAKKSEVELVRLESNEFRKEDRFAISTNIVLSYKGKEMHGKSIDISARGIAMQLDSPEDVDVNEKVLLSFIDYIDSECEFDLSKVPYKVVSCKDNVLRLEALNGNGLVGVRFWNKYISDNIDTLKIVGAQESLCGLRRALRNLVAQLHSSVPAFFTVKDSRPCVRNLGLSIQHDDAPLWSSIYGDFSADTQLKSFLYHKSVFRKLVLDLPDIRKTKPFKNYFLLVKYKQNMNDKLDIKNVIFLPDDKVAEKLKEELSGYQDDFRIFNVSLTKKSRLFDRYFKEELQYLESYSPHKASKLLFEIKTLTGVLDFDDVTDLMRSYLAQVMIN